MVQTDSVYLLLQSDWYLVFRNSLQAVGRGQGAGGGSDEK